MGLWFCLLFFVLLVGGLSKNSGIKTIADNSLKVNSGGEIVFNAGLRSKSIFISFDLYQGTIFVWSTRFFPNSLVELENPTWVDASVDAVEK